MIYLILQEHCVLQVDFWHLVLQGQAGQLKGKVKGTGKWRKKSRFWTVCMIHFHNLSPAKGILIWCQCYNISAKQSFTHTHTLLPTGCCTHPTRKILHRGGFLFHTLPCLDVQGNILMFYSVIITSRRWTVLMKCFCHIYTRHTNPYIKKEHYIYIFTLNNFCLHNQCGLRCLKIEQFTNQI